MNAVVYLSKTLSRLLCLVFSCSLIHILWHRQHCLCVVVHPMWLQCVHFFYCKLPAQLVNYDVAPVVISRWSFCSGLQLMNVLEEDEFAQNYQLANKLQKVHLLMRVRV